MSKKCSQPSSETDNSITGSTEAFKGFVVVENGTHDVKKLSAKSDSKADEIFSGFNESITLSSGNFNCFDMYVCMYVCKYLFCLFARSVFL